MRTYNMCCEGIEYACSEMRMQAAITMCYTDQLSINGYCCTFPIRAVLQFSMSGKYMHIYSHAQNVCVCVISDA